MLDGICLNVLYINAGLMFNVLMFATFGTLFVWKGGNRNVLKKE